MPEEGQQRRGVAQTCCLPDPDQVGIGAVIG